MTAGRPIDSLDPRLLGVLQRAGETVESASAVAEAGWLLADTEARYRALRDQAERARKERNAQITAALDAGWTHAQIAAATGLTRGRVGQLAHSGAGSAEPVARE